MDRNDKKQRPDNSGDQDKDLPGYPHYPPEDDIMNPKHGFKKIHADEELANSKSLSGKLVNERSQRVEPVEPVKEEDLGIVRGTDADVTAEDLVLLGDKDADMDLGDDELMKGKARVDDVPGEMDLDVPGSDENGKTGEEDEENDYYSLGGDRHENLEEDPLE